MSSLVSIIIPCYNQARWLAEAIERALAQTYPLAEVIVVDDGSRDRSAEIAGGFVPRIRVIRQSNRGEGEARNAGLRMATGEYVAFLDADDYWADTFLETRVSEITRTSVDVVVGRAHTVLETGEIRLAGNQVEKLLPPVEASRWFLVNEGVPVHSALVRREILAETRFSRRRFCSDYALWLNLGIKHSFLVSDKTLSYYRLHSGQVTRDRWKLPWHVHRVAREFWQEQKGALGWEHPAGMASPEYLRTMALWLYGEGNRRGFFWLMQRALFLSEMSAGERLQCLVMLVCAVLGRRAFLRGSWNEFDLFRMLGKVARRDGI